jgi:hypothetical protein
LILLENCRWGIDCYRDWSMSNWLFHVSNILWNINKSMDLTYSLGLIIFTSWLFTLVWIIWI